jgi:hypothetical protein
MKTCPYRKLYPTGVYRRIGRCFLPWEIFSRSAKASSQSWSMTQPNNVFTGLNVLAA